jgi:hypothetical protein
MKAVLLNKGSDIQSFFSTSKVNKNTILYFIHESWRLNFLVKLKKALATSLLSFRISLPKNAEEKAQIKNFL